MQRWMTMSDSAYREKLGMTGSGDGGMGWGKLTMAGGSSARAAGDFLEGMMDSSALPFDQLTVSHQFTAKISKSQEEDGWMEGWKDGRKAGCDMASGI